MKEIIPDFKDEGTPDQIKDFENEFQQAKLKLKSEICKACKQPITQEAWTRLNLDTMAEKVDKHLHVSYAYCYLIPTYHSHSTALDLETRLEFTEDGFTFRNATEKEAHKALLYGHGLILRLLKQQDDHFKLGLKAEIGARYEKFGRIWGNKELS